MPIELHLIKASHLQPLIQNMRALSMPVELLFEQAKLSPDLLIDQNQFMLENKIWRFLGAAAKLQKTPHLGLWLTEQSDLSQYEGFTENLLNAGNLYQALQLLINQVSLHNTDHTFQLKENDGYTWIYRVNYPYFTEGRWQFEQHMMSFICMLIAYYAGPNWFPHQIELQDAKGEGIEQSRFFKNSKIKLGQHHSAIAIDHALLKDRTLINKAVKHTELDAIPHLFMQGFKLLLKQNYFGKHWLAKDIAAILGISVRTLKRKLNAQNTSLRQVFDDVRFQQACDLIDQNIHDYTILAEKLSYTHPNNFVRAFKRWSGATPREFIRLRGMRNSHTESLQNDDN